MVGSVLTRQKDPRGSFLDFTHAEHAIMYEATFDAFFNAIFDLPWDFRGLFP